MSGNSKGEIFHYIFRFDILDAGIFRAWFHGLS